MKTSIPLTQETLSHVSGIIETPTYDRSQIRTGIVHIGVGGFHRAHQAYYLHQLMGKGQAFQWGICGVGLREGDRKIAAILKKQDYLYSLIQKHPNGKIETSVIGSIIDFLLGPDDPQAVINKMAAPESKIVSLTITEGGYNIDSATGEFDSTNEDIQHDLHHPQQPKTVFGYLAAALRKRFQEGIPAFTIQSCDNIQHNGDVTRKMLLAFVDQQDPELAQWIRKEVSFPNAMVDRITPVTSGSDLDYIQTELGIQDEWPVTCEPYCQWVIEDHFSNGRPAWETVGAQFVEDVTPYEKMKIRLLNAGHSVLGLLGSIHGHQTIDEAVVDPIFAAYLRAFMEGEVVPVLGPVEGIHLPTYIDSLFDRFSNPSIKDNLARICLESSAKIPKFLIPTILDNLKHGGNIRLSTLVIAAWCKYSDLQETQSGAPLEIVDAMKEELHEAAVGTRENPLSFLDIPSIFGELKDNPEFTNVYAEVIAKIYSEKEIEKLMERES